MNNIEVKAASKELFQQRMVAGKISRTAERQLGIAAHTKNRKVKEINIERARNNFTLAGEINIKAWYKAADLIANDPQLPVIKVKRNRNTNK